MLNLLYSAGARRLSIAAALVFAVPAALVFGQCIVPVPVPQPAQQQGFTTLAFDGDLTKGFDVSCANPASANHQWYLGANRSMESNCANLNYPHTDETDGSTVLDIHLGPSTNDGKEFGRVGISTSDLNSSHKTSFPINAYYECVIRFDSFSISHVPLWSNCWEADVNTSNNSINTIEYDFTEFHGGYQRQTEIGGTINWSCGGPGTCTFTNWFGNPADVIPGYDPAKFHKYAALQYQTGPNLIHIKGYVDDVLVHEGDADLSNTPGSATAYVENQKQRNAIVLDVTGACQWEAQEGDIARCQNMPITNIFADGSGNAHVKTSVTSTTMSDQFPLIIVGAGGTTPFNGPGGYFGAAGVWGQHGDNWGWWLPGQPCVDANSNVTGCEFSLLDSPYGQPVKMSGSYTGGGTINPWSDPGMHVYVKSFRVWSCANWATTQCSTYNPF